MAVVEVNEMWSNQKFDIEQQDNFSKTARIQQGWQIVVGPDTTELEISNYGGLPATGDVFTGLPYMFLRKRAFQRVSPILWMGMMEYRGELGIAGGAPWNDPPEISWTDTESDEAIDEDWNGNPIVTANGEAIYGATMKVADLVATIERKYRTFNPAATHAYRHSTNSDNFLGFAAGTGRLVGFSAKQEWSQDYGGFWKVRARIQFRYPWRTTPQRAWWVRLRHEGFYVRRADGRVFRATDGRKDAQTKPVLLKPNGTKETDPDNAHYLEFQRYGYLPYNALGLL